MERNFLERLKAAENFLERLGVLGEQTIRDARTFGHPLSMSPPGILFNSAAAMPSFLDEIGKAEESMRRLSGPVAYDESGRLVSGAGKVAIQELIDREAGPGSAAMTEAATRGAALAGGTALVGTAPKGALRSGLARGANRLYHGADTKITNFHVAPRRISSMGDGVYLTTRPEKAARYGNVIHSVKADGKLLNWAKPEKKVIEAIKKEVKLPPNKIAGFGPVRREVFNIDDPLAERRFLELKKMTEGFYHDRAKAKLVDVGDGKVAIEWRDPGLDNANGENLMHLLQEAGVDMRKLALDLGYDGAKFGDEVVIFDASKAKVIGVE